jgi:hypothetical protein
VDKEPDFDMVIQRHLTRAHKLRAIQQMIVEDPALVPDLLEVLKNMTGTPAGPAPVRATDPRRRVDAKTQAEKVIAFFRAHRDDELFTVRDIAEGTGLTRNTVNALLYNSGQKDLFYRIHVGPKRVVWRLRKEDDDDEGVVDDPEIVAEHEEIMRKRGEPEE